MIISGRGEAEYKFLIVQVRLQGCVELTTANNFTFIFYDLTIIWHEEERYFLMMLNHDFIDFIT